ncbi:MAG: hypothetical protein RLZZ244_486 [Verrucomicrobiota bacterium]
MGAEFEKVPTGKVPGDKPGLSPERRPPGGRGDSPAEGPHGAALAPQPRPPRSRHPQTPLEANRNPTQASTEAWENEGGASLQSRAAHRPLRILLVGHQFQVRTEGQAKACALARHPDLLLEVVTPRVYREAETRWRRPTPPVQNGYGFHVQRVRLPWAGPAKWYLQWYPDFARTLCEYRPDLIDVWEEPWNLLSAEICWLRDRLLPECKIVLETEQNIARTLPPPFEWIRTYCLRRADFLIGRSSEAVQVARSKGYQGPARVVGNGVDPELFFPRGPQERRRCREALGISGFAVGFAGRLVEEKGLEELLEALEQLWGRGGEHLDGKPGAPSLPPPPFPPFSPNPPLPPYTLWLCGEGPLAASIAERIARGGPRGPRSGGVPPGGVLDSIARERLPEFYNALDVLVLPSRTTARWKEQFGRVVAEAQACGIPVIGSDSGAIPEVLDDSGLVFPEGNARTLADAIDRLRRDSSLRETLAQKGRKQTLERYAWDAIAHQMREVYLQTMDAAASPLGPLRNSPASAAHSEEAR